MKHLITAVALAGFTFAAGATSHKEAPDMAASGAMSSTPNSRVADENAPSAPASHQ